MKRVLRCQRGGVALVMVLAFMALGTPVVTSTLNLADSFSIDSRTKRSILENQYCGLAVVEYVKYLNLNLARWDDWWDTNQAYKPSGGRCSHGDGHNLRSVDHAVGDSTRR